MTYRKNGGLRFLRIGRIQFTVCVCKPRPARHADYAAPLWIVDVLIWTTVAAIAFGTVA